MTLLITWAVMKAVMPKWLRNNLSVLQKFLKDPVNWVYKRIVEFILGVVGTIVFGIAGRIENSFSIIIEALELAGEPIVAQLNTSFAVLNILVSLYSNALVDVANLAGPAGPVLLLALWALTFAGLFVLGRAAVPALTDLLGAIPIVGSALDTLTTFLAQVIGRGISIIRGDDS